MEGQAVSSSELLEQPELYWENKTRVVASKDNTMVFTPRPGGWFVCNEGSCACGQCPLSTKLGGRDYTYGGGFKHSEYTLAFEQSLKAVKK